MILYISPTGGGIGVARHMRKVAKKQVVLFAPAHREEEVAGVPNIAGGRSTQEAINTLIKFVNSSRIEFVVIDMIEKFKKPMLLEGKSITTFGDIAEWLHSKGLKGIGVFPYATALERLEFERQDGCDMAAAVGLNVPETKHFASIAEGIKFLQSAENKQRRWVFKPNENIWATYVPDNNSELIFIMSTIAKEFGDKVDYVLQEYIDGIEVDIEGWFCNGEYIEGSTNITLESKTHMTGNVGLGVGCATTVQKAVDEESYLFRKALQPYFPLLRRWQYTGAFSVTCIVDDKKKIWYLENCCRMGWDAFYAMLELYDGTAYDFFMQVLTGSPITLKSGWGYGVRVSIPPYPLEAHGPEEQQALAVLKRAYLSNCYLYGINKASQFARIWLVDVSETDMKIDDEPVFKVINTEPCVVTTYHETSPFKAEKAAVNAIDKLVLPNLQARIGDGAYGAYQRFCSLIDRGIIVTKERKRLKLTEAAEVFGDEKTASD